ncbi:ester cyclase [Knoellia sp. CPCC 206435]|uniref:ester cyclase n=1 Tax=Knoellia terrae TaxID=3404797 RepID=UPI003B432095
MSIQETERLVRQYLDALLNRGDFASFFADDVVWTTMETGDQVRGRDAVKDFIITMHTQLFDASPELGNITFADGVAGVEAVFVGTHTAEFAGVPATGTSVRLPYTVFYDVADGAIAALRGYLPISALVQQLAGADSRRSEPAH